MTFPGRRLGDSQHAPLCSRGDEPTEWVRLAIIIDCKKNDFSDGLG